MNEKVLHYIWKYQLFSDNTLSTSQKEAVLIQKVGMHNLNAGPDFLNCAVKINQNLWVGNIEIHQKSSDWYLHNHHLDEHYKAVILHVVWEHDINVFNPSQQIIPTLELKNFVDEDFLTRYEQFVHYPKKWILCENELTDVDFYTTQNWLERLFFERLEQKSIAIKNLLNSTNNDWEAVFFILMCKNFGAKINSEAFLQLAQSFEYQLIRKEKGNLLVLEALLFGQAGFLNQTLEDAYFKKLQNEYQFLVAKYNLKSISSSQFHFFRLRPQNFPTVRLAQLAGILHHSSSLFSRLMEVKSKEGVYKILNSDISEFWNTHFTFEKESILKKKKLTKSFIDLLIINTIIPLKFAYEKQKGSEFEEELLAFLSSLKPESNSIIQKFEMNGIKVENALHSQALLQLKNEYCEKGKCLDCSFGNAILRK